MTSKRIKKAITVIKYAIKHDLSLSKASEKCGHSPTYVKNVKGNVLHLWEAGELPKNEYDAFFDVYQEYIETSEHANKGRPMSVGLKKNMKVPQKLRGNKTSYREIDEETAEASWEYTTEDKRDTQYF